MTLWIIEPRDPLIVRDGRPFGPNPGARARSLDFPYPSTVVGGFRSQAGKDSDGFFDINKRPDVKKVSIRGPLLVELDEQNRPNWLIPAPADALLLRKDDDAPVFRHRLQPLENTGTDSDLPVKLKWLVGMISDEFDKPYKKAPQYWYWQAFAEWLTTPPGKKQEIDAMSLGHNGPGKEWRIHVAINADTLTGEEGALFATSGLEFWQRPSADQSSSPNLSDVKRLGLAAEVANLNGMVIHEGPAPLGGERRMMQWYDGKAQLPALPDGLVDSIAESGYCRLILLTPACFTAGWQPEWLLQTRDGVTPGLEAAVVGKPQTVSGWNFEPPVGPKPTRRLVPAGSVYFLRLGNDKPAIKKWIENIWLQNVSDTAEDRLAGFGLTAVGVWDGQPQMIKEASHG